MKKITTYLAIALFGMSASFAQTDPDIGISRIDNMYSGIPTYPNVPFSAEYVIKNYGLANFADNVADTIRRTLRVAQGSINSIVSTARTQTGGLAPGAETGAIPIAAPVDFSAIGLSAGNVDVCINTQLRKNNTNIDVNTSNDESCQTASYSGDNTPLTWDMGIFSGSVRVIFSSGDSAVDGDVITEESFAQLVRFDLWNAGNTDVPAGVTYYFRLDFNGVQQGSGNFFYTLQSPLGGGGVARLPLQIDLLNSGIFLPESGGNQLEICVGIVDDSYDTDNSNDKTCSTFDSTVGIDDETTTEDEEEISVTYFNRNLTVSLLEGTTGNTEIDVISITGQRVFGTNVNADFDKVHTVDLNDLNSGVYIVTVKTSDNQVKTERIIIE